MKSVDNWEKEIPPHRTRERQVPSQRHRVIPKILLLFLLTVSTWAQSDESAGTAKTESASGGPASAATPTAAAKSASLLVLPFISGNAPGFAPLVAEKVVSRRFGDAEVLNIIALEKEALEITDPSAVASMSDTKLVSSLSEIGSEAGASYVIAGRIEKEGSLYHLSLLTVNADGASVVLREKKTAVGIADLDRIAQEFTERFLEIEFGVAAAETVAENRAAESAAAAVGAGAGLAELEKLAEENPEKAIEKLPEKVQEEVKKKAKQEAIEEVKQEEVQKLFEEEKAQEKELRRRRNYQIAAFSAYGAKIVGDGISDIGMQSRMRALRGWSFYMNQYNWADYFDQYRDFHERAQRQAIGGNSVQVAAHTTLSYLFFRYPGGYLTTSDKGRRIYAVSSGLYTLGEAIGFGSAILGYGSMQSYDKYLVETNKSDISDKYDAYRLSHLFYETTRYTSYGLKLLGIAGTVAAFTVYSGDEPFVESSSNRSLMGFSHVLSGAAAVSAHMALNTYARGIEAGISARSPSGNPEADPAKLYGGYTIAFATAAVGLYTASFLTEYRALMGPGRKRGKKSAAANRGVRTDDRRDLSLAFLPYRDGFSVNFSLRSYGR
jgi:hypothetical protein